MVIYQPSTRILKQSTKNCSDTLHKLFNDGLRNVNFTDKLKCANTTPVSNKDDPKKQNQKKKKRPGSALPGVSKYFERPMHKQMFALTNFSTLTCVAIKKVSVSNTYFYLLLKNGKRCYIIKNMVGQYQ